MTHSRVLEDTELWNVYAEKTKDDPARMAWTKEVCYMAGEHLKAVRDTFDNYTLHDEKHVLNVQDAMSGLLGNRIDELKTGEAELLILVSALHDLGMIYTEQDREDCLTDNAKLHEYYCLHPEYRTLDMEDWSELDKQNYLRWLHPFRVGVVLHQAVWKEQFDKRPKEVVSESVIIAVCQAHGESLENIRREVTEPNGRLKYQRFKDVDPLFCAILLRLADILDFDDSRAPSTLFSYAGRSIKSVEEWKKHVASMGFNYSSNPNTDNLPYGAIFTDPNVERSAHIFLDWVDEELSRSRSLLPLTCTRWKGFPFPFQVDRSEIERKGYDYGDFKITMDQDRIMDLLVGEKLYSDRSVFIRELLQNSIDATLIRSEMDTSFANKINTDEARIDLWEWWDNNGNWWFRIDDCGTGMTRGMLEKYFLKAGNSYYNSKELNRDLNGKPYSSISRFGIGFLSCFLCGIDAYVSTTYWNPEKNIREAERDPRIRYEKESFGLRMDVIGLTGYYTLRNQAIMDNCPEPLPSPPITVPHPDENYEKDGYRTQPGTSIVIRLDAGRLGSRSLLEVAKHWVCFPRMPIYYNGERLCMTQEELVALVKDEHGIKEYELTDEEKSRFDSFLPEQKGNYPRIRETIELFEADHVPGLPRQKILFCETRVLISDEKRLWRGGFGYKYTGRSALCKPGITIYCAGDDNEDLTLAFQSKDNRRLFDELSINEDFLGAMHYGWKGIFVYHNNAIHNELSPTIIVIDEDEERPDLKANRDYLVSVPLKTVITSIAWLERHFSETEYSKSFVDLSRVPLKEWRTVNSEDYLKWVDLSSWNKFINFKEALENSISFGRRLPKELSDSIANSHLFWKEIGCSDIRFFFLAHLQLNYRVLVSYSDKRLSFCELDSTERETKFDLFPLMPFGYGETEKDCAIICTAKAKLRLVITANHPFVKWILKNVDNLYMYYPRQFEQIVFGLQHYDAGSLIMSVNQVIEQLSITSHRYGIDISNCPKLTMDDFWEP